MRRFCGPILAMSALAICGMGLLATTNSASATVVSNVPIHQHIQGDRVKLPVENVARRGGRRGGYRGGRYNRRYYGRRYRGRRRGYGHYYRGYWYSNPWWIVGTGVAIGAGAAAASGGRCGWVSRQCTARWGYGGPNYWGCMRYDRCN